MLRAPPRTTTPSPWWWIRRLRDLLAELEHGGGTRFAFARPLAAKAFAHTARYDTMVGPTTSRASMPPRATTAPSRRRCPRLTKRCRCLRYGENPHQAGGVLPRPERRWRRRHRRMLQGKELSFNNIADADTAIECVRQFAAPACVIVKHANPCGVAVADTPLAAYERAYRTDPTSAFGGIIAFNRELDGETARASSASSSSR
jgi:phosphoribosylaminoimidazolecarboxamide formyltransferase/IMP cyclohydrolase